MSMVAEEQFACWLSSYCVEPWRSCLCLAANLVMGATVLAATQCQASCSSLAAYVELHKSIATFVELSILSIQESSYLC